MKKSDVKTENTVYCISCESDYKISFWETSVANPPEFCPFCGEPLTEDDIDENESTTTEEVDGWSEYED